MELQQRITTVNWADVTESMHAKGYASIPNILSADECDKLVANYPNETGYRKTIVMEHHGYGLGQYKYYSYPLPGMVQQLRETVYPNIAPIANKWMEVLGIDKQFPATLNELTDLCHQHGQLRPTPLILKYNKGGYNAMHQDLYGEVYSKGYYRVNMKHGVSEVTKGDRHTLGIIFHDAT